MLTKFAVMVKNQQTIDHNLKRLRDLTAEGMSPCPLDSDHQVIGSIAQKGDRFIQEIKARDDVLLVKVSDENRDDPEFFSRLLSVLG